MAAFTSNIDITSGGTYNMNITNGEPASQVATDLNGKFANIQRYLQNGLPEVWTGSSLPDSLPDGKITNFKDILYYGTNKVRLASYNDIIGTSISLGLLKQLQGSFQLDRSTSSSNNIINLGTTPECLIVGHDMDVCDYGRIFTAYTNNVPMIVLRSHVNTDSAGQGSLIIKIVQNGFSYDFSQGYDYTNTITLNYISFYIA